MAVGRSAITYFPILSTNRLACLFFTAPWKDSLIIFFASIVIPIPYRAISPRRPSYVDKSPINFFPDSKTYGAMFKAIFDAKYPPADFRNGIANHAIF